MNDTPAITFDDLGLSLDTLRAVAITAGGESGHPDSPHFADQVQRYIDGHLREVYFYPRQPTGHTERVYHPGR